MADTGLVGSRERPIGCRPKTTPSSHADDGDSKRNRRHDDNILEQRCAAPKPARRPTPSDNAKTPNGPAINTQRTITIMASETARNKFTI